MISPEQVAECALQGIDNEEFLILPHPEVEQFIQFKSANYNRWLGGMRKLRRKVLNQIGTARPQDIHKFV